MNDIVVRCPNCNNDVHITQSLAAPMLEETRREYNNKLAAMKRQIESREDNLEKARDALESTIRKRLDDERKKIASETVKRLRLEFENDLQSNKTEIAELERLLKEKNARIAKAQQTEAEVLQKRRQLDDAIQDIALTVEARVQESLDQVRETVRVETEEKLRLQVKDREQVIATMQRQIDDLKRKAQQGSQQAQGEVLERELEACLRSAFSADVITVVGKGKNGADLLQEVHGPGGKAAGSILWESKRTKTWSDQWIPKLKRDRDGARASIAIIVSQALPSGIETFGYKDGVWVTSIRYAVPLATALRYSLKEIELIKVSNSNKQSKIDLVYAYLTGSEFRRRVQTVVETFIVMADDLEKERRAITRQWAKREQQLRNVIDCTAGLYGDLQGISGQALPGIKGLGLEEISQTG